MKDQKCIFISTSSPMVIRNFFLIPNGVFTLLKKSGSKIVMLVPEQAYENVSRDFKEDNVIVEPVKIFYRKNFIQKTYTFVSTYLNFTSTQRLFASIGVRVDIPAAAGRSYLYYLKFLIHNTLGRSKWVRDYLMPKIDNLVYRERPYKEIFDRHRPDIVLLPDVHSQQDVTTLREAKRQGVMTIGMPGSWDHFPKRFEPLRADKLMVWNEVNKKEAIELQDYKKKNIIVTGAPYYDIFAKKEFLLGREEFLSKYGLDKNKKTIFFASATKYSPHDGDIIDMMLSFIENNKLAGNAQIFLRPYPGVEYEHGKFDKYNGRDSLYIDWIEPKKIFGNSGLAWYPDLDSMVHFMNSIYHADIIVVNAYSSVCVEASLFLKPLININFDGYQNLPYSQSVKRFERYSQSKYIIETGGLTPVESQNELLETLNIFLKDPKANENKVKILRDMMCWKIDGKSSERIAEAMLNFLSA